MGWPHKPALFGETPNPAPTFMPLTLDTKSAGFSLTNALACAEASRLAYEQSTVCSPLASAVILDQADATIIAFKGTANIRDWLTDFQCRRVNGVHGGFHRSFSSVLDSLSKALSVRPPKPLFITGHSKGGAEAVLAGCWFSSMAPQVYTFGQPRVGGAEFAAECEERFGHRHFRFVNQEDVVPRVPLWTLGFRHSGKEYFFPALGPMRVGSPLWFKLLSDAYGFYLDWRARRCLSEFTDHGIEHYIEQLEKVPSLTNQFKEGSGAFSVAHAD